jgi:hypothetical protein
VEAVQTVQVMFIGSTNPSSSSLRRPTIGVAEQPFAVHVQYHYGETSNPL